MQLASRRYLDSQSLWLLSGLAKRIGQTMGLHRESSLRKLPPFEAEIRRRLWWQLVIMDSRSAQLSGVYVDAAVNTFWDTRRPLNVSDSDLSPYMKELPKERDGPTEMLFCTIRTEIGECIRQLQVMYKNSKVTHVTCLAQKMRLMDECEGRLDQSILKELDLSIPLHLFALYLAKSAFLQMRLSACHPQQYPDRGASLPKEEKDKLFDMALQIIAYDSLTYSNKSLGGYLWHVIMHFPFEAFILVLTELLTRLKGDDVDRAWLRVKQAYEDHPELITEAPKTPLYFALGNLTIKAWDKRMLSTQQEQHLAHRPIMAPAISKLKGQRMSHSSITEPGLQSNAYLADVYSYQGARPPSSSVQPDSGSSVDWNGQHGQFLLTDASDMGWESWNSLLQGAGDHSRFYGDGIGQNFHMG